VDREAAPYPLWATAGLDASAVMLPGHVVLPVGVGDGLVVVGVGLGLVVVGVGLGLGLVVVGVGLGVADVLVPVGLGDGPGPPKGTGVAAAPLLGAAPRPK